MSSLISDATPIDLTTIGDISAALAAELAPHAQLSAATRPDANGVLFDGSATPDRETLRTALGSGQLVIIARPAKAYLDVLLALTGQSCTRTPDAVLYRRLLQYG